MELTMSQLRYERESEYIYNISKQLRDGDFQADSRHDSSMLGLGRNTPSFEASLGA